MRKLLAVSVFIALLAGIPVVAQAAPSDSTSDGATGATGAETSDPAVSAPESDSSGQDVPSDAQPSIGGDQPADVPSSDGDSGAGQTETTPEGTPPSTSSPAGTSQ
jgi:hypothetical protein